MYNFNLNLSNKTKSFLICLQDIVLHVRDISHPDVEHQGVNVMMTLKDRLTEKQMDDIIEVYNKVDKLPR